ncbi:hypothetical protein F383_26525 [Gossypium arboreum]|uniref:Uncharacterized protein n=1 Tax=Gossypium arboreum TaxID=29729 RepID=A0A0B0PAK7_GOSAR|nr:hypothetical protein F383_26525 [Gossypium arboreum]
MFIYVSYISNSLAYIYIYYLSTSNMILILNIRESYKCSHNNSLSQIVCSTVRNHKDTRIA